MKIPNLRIATNQTGRRTLRTEPPVPNSVAEAVFSLARFSTVDKSGRCRGGKDIPCTRQDGEGVGEGHLAKCSLVRGSDLPVALRGANSSCQNCQFPALWAASRLEE